LIDYELALQASLSNTQQTDLARQQTPVQSVSSSKRKIDDTDPFTSTQVAKSSKTRQRRGVDALSDFGDKIVSSLKSTIEPPRSTVDPISTKAIEKIESDKEISALVKAKIITMFLRHPEMAGGYMVIKSEVLARTVLLEMLEQLGKSE
jgi:hypothetical protein